jgi:hypothetical protein
MNHHGYRRPGALNFIDVAAAINRHEQTGAPANMTTLAREFSVERHVIAYAVRWLEAAGYVTQLGHKLLVVRVGGDKPRPDVVLMRDHEGRHVRVDARIPSDITFLERMGWVRVSA